MTWGRPPLAVWDDAEAALVDYLAGRLVTFAARPEVGVELTADRVGVVLPADFVARSSAPFVLVEHEGSPSAVYPVRVAASLRVVCFHRTRTLAKALAGLCYGLALTYPGGDPLRRVGELTPPVPDVDPDNGADIAAFTVRAEVGATVL